MSYLGSMSDAKAAIASVELSENTRTSSGSSPVRDGSNGPGGAAVQLAGGTAKEWTVGRLRAGIKTPKTKHSGLVRKYAAS